MIEITVEFGVGIDVPDAERTEGRALPTLVDGGAPTSQLVHVLSGSSAPADAYAAVPYRGCWYWVADQDLTSKLRFTVLMILSGRVVTPRRSEHARDRTRGSRERHAPRRVGGTVVARALGRGTGHAGLDVRLRMRRRRHEQPERRQHDQPDRAPCAHRSDLRALSPVQVVESTPRAARRCRVKGMRVRCTSGAEAGRLVHVSERPHGLHYRDLPGRSRHLRIAGRS
jgi:hypothetical protein